MIHSCQISDLTALGLQEGQLDALTLFPSLSKCEIFKVFSVLLLLAYSNPVKAGIMADEFGDACKAYCRGVRVPSESRYLATIQ